MPNKNLRELLKIMNADDASVFRYAMEYESQDGMRKLAQHMESSGKSLDEIGISDITSLNFNRKENLGLFELQKATHYFDADNKKYQGFREAYDLTTLHYDEALEQEILTEKTYDEKILSRYDQNHGNTKESKYVETFLENLPRLGDGTIDPKNANIQNAIKNFLGTIPPDARKQANENSRLLLETIAQAEPNKNFNIQALYASSSLLSPSPKMLKTDLHEYNKNLVTEIQKMYPVSPGDTASNYFLTFLGKPPLKDWTAKTFSKARKETRNDNTATQAHKSARLGSLSNIVAYGVRSGIISTKKASQMIKNENGSLKSIREAIQEMDRNAPTHNSEGRGGR